MERHVINIRNHWKHLWDMLFYLLLCCGIILYGIFIRESGSLEKLNSYLIVVSVIFFAQAIPQFAMHVRYNSINKSDALEYDKLYKEIIFKTQNKVVKFNLADIKEITFSKSYALHKKNIQLLLWDSYNHAIIILNDGSQIILTSLLLGGEISFPIDEDKKKVKMNLYRWVNGPSLKILKSVSG